MELTTVKSCFEKYVTFLKSHEEVCVMEKYDLDSMTVNDIDKLTQILFMDYVIKCENKVNHCSVPCTLYKHVHNLIRQYIQDDSSKTISHLNDHIFRLEDDNTKLRKEIISKPDILSPNYSVQTKSNGWFF